MRPIGYSDKLNLIFNLHINSSIIDLLETKLCPHEQNEVGIIKESIIISNSTTSKLHDYKKKKKLFVF